MLFRSYRGFIERTPDAQDRRRVRLGLTEAGFAILAKAREAVKASFAAKLAGLGPQDVELVTGSMRLLHTLFTQPLDNGATNA